MPPKGYAMTVLGPVLGDQLGVTLSHEHIIIDVGFYADKPNTAFAAYQMREPITLRNRGWQAYHWTAGECNCMLTDPAIAVAELLAFKHGGGQTVVDPTGEGMGRDPLGLARISRETGLNILMGSGYYVDPTHPDDMDDRSMGELAEGMIREFEEGVGNTGIVPGLIGEIGCSWPLTPNEEKALRASAKVQRSTGAILMVHPGRNPDSPKTIMRILGEEKADPERVIMCHVDRTCLDKEWLDWLASTGCYIEYDLFGYEHSYYPLNPSFDMPSDAQRLDLLAWHFDRGDREKILISHDIAIKTRLREYGGLGYDHITSNIAPRMIERGFHRADIDQLLVKNTGAAFSFV